MDQIINNLGDFLGASLPRILTAVAVLIIGFLVAFVLAKVVRSLLRKTKLDTMLARMVSGDTESNPPQVEYFVSQLVFYVLVVAAFVAFFTSLGIPEVTQPVNDFLRGFFTYLPNLVAGVVLLIIALFIANVAKIVAKRGLRAINFEQKVATGVETASQNVQEAANNEDSELADQAQKASSTLQQVQVTDVVANIIYYLVIILFLPAILGTLQLTGILSPVQELVNKLLGYIPNLFSAFLIVFVGYFVAKILRVLTTNFLRAVGFDVLGMKAGISGVMGGRNLSSLAGTVVYVLVLLPVIVAALNALQLEAVTRPASNLIDRILGAMPGVFGAALLLILAYVVGKVVSEILSNLLTNLGFDSILEKIGLKQVGAKVEQSGSSPSKAVAGIALAYIMIFATIEALGMLEFNQLAVLLTRFVALTGNILIGLVIFAVGLIISQFVADTIRNSALSSSNMLATVARISISVLAGAMALGQMGLATEIVNLAFGLTLGALAVAFALAFGLGGREAAGDLTKEMFKKLRNK